VEEKNAELLESVQRLLREALSEESARPVLPSLPHSTVRDQLDLTLTPEGKSLDQVIDELITLAAGTPRTNSRHFFNQLFGGRENAAVAGEVLSAILNNSMYTYKAAGPQILLERALLRHMAGLVGMPRAEGSFQAGGSLSNLLGLLLARNRAFPGWREEGPGGQRPVMYTSSESHYSVVKAAGILGIGRENVRRIAVDERGRMSAEELERQIEADLHEDPVSGERDRRHYGARRLRPPGRTRADHRPARTMAARRRSLRRLGRPLSAAASPSEGNRAS